MAEAKIFRPRVRDPTLYTVYLLSFHEISKSNLCAYRKPKRHAISYQRICLHHAISQSDAFISIIFFIISSQNTVALEKNYPLTLIGQLQNVHLCC